MSYSSPRLPHTSQYGGTSRVFSTEIRNVNNLAPASAAWPAANLGLYIPVYFDGLRTITQMFWANGSTVTGSTTLDIGLYDENGAQLVHSSQTQSGTSTIQTANITDTVIPRGRYYVGIVLSNNTSHLFRWTNIAAFANENKLLGIGEQAIGSAVLPGTATFAASARGYIPLVGVAHVATLAA